MDGSFSVTGNEDRARTEEENVTHELNDHRKKRERDNISQQPKGSRHQMPLQKRQKSLPFFPFLSDGENPLSCGRKTFKACHQKGRGTDACFCGKVRIKKQKKTTTLHPHEIIQKTFLGLIPLELCTFTQEHEPLSHEGLAQLQGRICLPQRGGAGIMTKSHTR